MRKIPRFFARNRNLCNFGLYFSEFGCHGNSLGSLENCDSIFEIADPESWLFMQKMPRFLAQDWNQCNFGLFLFKFGCHGNSLGSLKILIAYWNSPAPKSPLYMRIHFPISYRELMSASFWPKFCCHGNHPDSHEILYTIFEFANPENLIIMW